MGTPCTLYGAEISYFTGKVRAYLRWAGIPFDEVLADAEVYRNIIVPGVGAAVIPVLRTPEGTLLQDSTEIIDALDAQQQQAGATLSVYPPTPVQKLVALLLETYGDEWLVIPAMHYRWHHNRAWAEQQFGALNAPDATPEQQREIGARRAAPFAKAAELLGATPPLHAAVEASYEGLMAELDAHFAQHAALLGGRATMADFGLIGPLYAHQYRDPASGALMRSRAPNLLRWVEQLQFEPQGLRGALPADDQVPDTLLPVLRRLAREMLPVLVDTAQRVRAWMAEHPGEPLPRALGTHAFTLEGVQGERIVRPYSLWMLQRVRDHYRTLADADRMRADALLQAVGAQALIEFPDPPRLLRDRLSVRPAPA
ncbi:MAG: glutathione S-transferase [Burkholderiales bacterium]|nr:glutathione S-transferase [Burkholderiales bacterium]